MRVAITGYGIISAAGRGIEPFRQALKLGIQRCSRLEGMQVPRGKDRFALADFPDSVDRSARMSLQAAREALAVSGCDLGDGTDVGMIVGTVWGETQSAENFYPRLLQSATPNADGLEAMRRYPAGSIANSVADALNIRGPRLTFSNACASGNIAMGQGLDLIRSQMCRVVIVVGVDRFSLAGLWGAERSGFVGRDLQPFDRERKGTVLGEGAAAVVLEADKPGVAARAKAWLEGYACVCEPGAAAITLLEDGLGLQMSMKRALADAGRSTPEIDYVNAHSPGTPMIDGIESRAIASVWKSQPRTPAVNATKSLTGHMSGASAVAETIAVILQLEDQFLHGNIGLKNPDPAIAVPVMGPEAKPAKVDCAISNACGGGGLNTTVVLSGARIKASHNGHAKIKPRIVLTGFGGLKAPARGQGDKELEWFDVHQWIEPETNIASLNRCAHIGGAAGVMAIQDASLHNGNSELKPEEVAVFGGVWLGGWIAGSVALADGLTHDPVEIFPSTALNNGCHLGSVIICRKFGFTGPTYTVCGNLTAGLQAMVVASDLLKAGRSRAAVVLGYDVDDPWLRRTTQWMPQCNLLSQFVEGGASLVLETEQAALARGAQPKAVVQGGACISGPLKTATDIAQAGNSLLQRLNHPKFDRVVLSGPADGGMRRLAEKIAHSSSATLEGPEPTHSLAAESLFAVGRAAGHQNTLVLAGESGGSQVGVLLCEWEGTHAA
jgi:3-oxoacyl-(acyl-carrier-protein) synthase